MFATHVSLKYNIVYIIGRRKVYFEDLLNPESEKVLKIMKKYPKS